MYELSSTTGSIVHHLGYTTYQFDEPVGIAVDASKVWVINAQSDSITEFSRP